MVAAASFARNMPELIRVGLSEIPRTSRLHHDTSEVIDDYADGVDYDSAVAYQSILFMCSPILAPISITLRQPQRSSRQYPNWVSA